MAILIFGGVFKKSLAHSHIARHVMFKLTKKLSSSLRVFAPTRKRDAGQKVCSELKHFSLQYHSWFYIIASTTLRNNTFISGLLYKHKPSDTL